METITSSENLTKERSSRKIIGKLFEKLGTTPTEPNCRYCKPRMLPLIFEAMQEPGEPKTFEGTASMMTFIVTSLFAEDLKYLKQYDRESLEKVRRLCLDIIKNPFEGIGRPKPLYPFDGVVWSRTIAKSKKSRLLYIPLSRNEIKLISCDIS